MFFLTRSPTGHCSRRCTGCVCLAVYCGRAPHGHATSCIISCWGSTPEAASVVRRPASNPDAMASLPPPAHRPVVMSQGDDVSSSMLPYGVSEEELQRERQQLERVSLPLLNGTNTFHCAEWCTSGATVDALNSATLDRRNQHAVRVEVLADFTSISDSSLSVLQQASCCTRSNPCSWQVITLCCCVNSCQEHGHGAGRQPHSPVPTHNAQGERGEPAGAAAGAAHASSCCGAGCQGAGQIQDRCVRTRFHKSTTTQGLGM